MIIFPGGFFLRRKDMKNDGTFEKHEENINWPGFQSNYFVLEIEQIIHFPSSGTRNGEY